MVANEEGLEVGGFRTGRVGIDYKPTEADQLDRLLTEIKVIDIQALPESTYHFFLTSARNQYFRTGIKGQDSR